MFRLQSAANVFNALSMAPAPSPVTTPKARTIAQCGAAAYAIIATAVAAHESASNAPSRMRRRTTPLRKLEVM